ncbi:MAG TPA: NAD(P)-dependent oxidoreductase [Acidimicrobiales bacterium]|nr:NAD(P)-dependent oxidoreductase [Acidimicrobiales bacterium]
MEKALVWVGPGMRALIEGAPEGLEIEEIPTEPEADPRLSEVRYVVLGAGRPPLAEWFSKMTSLEVIQTTSAGVDNVAAQIPPGVKLCSARGSYAVVAEWVVGAILAEYKAFPFFRDEQRAGRWSKREARRLIGEKVLLLGYGGIAESVEERLAPFGTEFLRVARTARPGVQTLAELPGLLPEADVIVLLVPLTGETEGLVDRDFLAKVKPGALLVNAARGKVVDTDALIEALEAERIAAVLDVTDPEPLPDGHRLFSTPNVFITPHVAGGPLARPEVLAFIREQLGRFARREELANVVTDGY